MERLIEDNFLSLTAAFVAILTIIVEIGILTPVFKSQPQAKPCIMEMK